MQHRAFPGVPRKRGWVRCAIEDRGAIRLPMNDRFLSVSVTEFARDWIRMVAKADPSAPGLIDFEGFELALRDLVGPPDIRSVPSREIELIASILPQFPARLIDDLKRDLARLEALRQVAIKLTWLFHTARGSSLDSSTLREARRG